jgi:hypothetical protein
MTLPSLIVAEETGKITAVMHRYCRAMDRIDAKLGYSVWHDDGTADYGPFFKGSGRDFIDWVCNFHRTLISQFHQVTNILIDVMGEHATSESYVTAALLFQNGHKISSSQDAEAVGTSHVSEIFVKRTTDATHDDTTSVQRLVTARGRYLDRWSLRHGCWAIDHRHCILDFASAQAVYDATLGSGKRDATDPSYLHWKHPGL